MKDDAHLGHGQEVALSYMTGLAPVGETFELPLAHVMADLGYQSKFGWYAILNKLIAKRRVRRIACGAGGTTGVFVVLQRLEAPQIQCRKT